MIVNTSIHGWEIIYQRAHGLLASKIGYHWQNKHKPDRWLETLTAISEHDDGQESWKGNYHITDAGAPEDFMLQEFSLDQARKVTGIAKYKSRWIALMISMHISYLYESLRGKSKEIDDFLNEQLANQKKYKKELKIKQTDAEKAYRLIHFCDRLSLILCQSKIPEDGRKLEIFTLPNGKKSFLSERKDKTLNVEPWIFDENEFEISVEVHCVDDLKFSSDTEFASAMDKATIKEKKWVFKK